MAKYDYDFKKSVVEAYRRGEGGYVALARRYGIPADSTVNKWVKIVEKLGFDALNQRKNKQTYSFQFKQDVIHYYLTSGDSYLDVAKNRIHRRFVTSVPHQKITTDTSEFKYYEQDTNGKPVIKKLYLDPFLDLFNGEVLSYRISKGRS